jgi:CheY-like chemotaxis protein
MRRSRSWTVDDDPAVRKALCRVLREEGWNVETFESAEASPFSNDQLLEAVRIALQSNPSETSQRT